MALSLESALAALLKSLPPRAVDQDALVELVDRALQDSKAVSTDDNRKSQWEYLLKNEIYKLAATEGTALTIKNTTYYDQLQGMLDLILTFTEQDACDQIFPFTVLQDLLETQTIASCSRIFDWIEERSRRLTNGMVPQKGKALVLLRTLNDLLRRLSKMGTTTIFCGRILTFLSNVFPLGERSGVNLRGEYGPMWETVKATATSDTPSQQEMESADNEADKMQVDSSEADKPPGKTANEKEDFYNTFWSLQLPFSRPPAFAAHYTFNEFKESVNKVLPYIKEANVKERAMLGSRSGTGAAGSLKRKRDSDTTESGSIEYFFAKFLTSPELLELEIADTHFRRQFLFQLLILLRHLLTFTKSAKTTWSTPRNRSLQMDFTLDPSDAQWAQETVTKAIDELRQTTPNGRAFADTVNVILEREKNWVKWKNELCSPFDKEPWFTLSEGGEKLGLEASTQDVREKFREGPEEWPWRLGSEPLTNIWQMGYRSLHDLENHFHPGEVKGYAKKVQLEDFRIETRKKTVARDRLAQARARTNAPVPTLPTASPETATNLPQKADALAATPSTPSRQPVSNSPLHPSLPAKPGAAPPPKPTPSLESIPSPSVSVVAPTPKRATVLHDSPAATPAPTDDQLAKYEENKQRWSWLALRTARDNHLQHFGKIGTGDVILLMQEIEKEKVEQEEQKKTGNRPLNAQDGAAAAVDCGASPLVATAKLKSEDGMEGVEGTN